MSLVRQLDWVAKLHLIEAYRERHDCEWDDSRLAALDLQYHDLRPERSLFARLSMERLTDDDSVIRAITEPPKGPGPGSGHLPRQMARRGRDGELGFPRLRPRHRPTSARPYDGSTQGN